MKLSDLIPPQFKLVAIGLVVLAIGAGLTWAYSAIYQRGWNAHVVVAEAEKRLLREANERAIAEAEKRLRVELDFIRDEKERLEDAIARIELEADADPDAERLGISAGSVRRIEAVR